MPIRENTDYPQQKPWQLLSAVNAVLLFILNKGDENSLLTRNFSGIFL